LSSSAQMKPQPEKKPLKGPLSTELSTDYVDILPIWSCFARSLPIVRRQINRRCLSHDLGMGRLRAPFQRGLWKISYEG
jgi:hypothetical protein